MLISVVFGLLVHRLIRVSTAKRAAQGVAADPRRSGGMPNLVSQGAPSLRLRPPLAYLPALPTLLALPGNARVFEDPPAPKGEAFPAFPTGRYVEEEAALPRLTPAANHLFVDTQPHGAHVWIDGEWKGQTPVDLLVGAGNKELVLVAAGHRVFRESFEAAQGAAYRRALTPAPEPVLGEAFLDVICRSAGRFPVVIDQVETGLLCPARRVPVAAGTHQIGVYVPKDGKLTTVEITVQAGPKPVEIHLEI